MDTILSVQNENFTGDGKESERQQFVIRTNHWSFSGIHVIGPNIVLVATRDV